MVDIKNLEKSEIITIVVSAVVVIVVGLIIFYFTGIFGDSKIIGGEDEVLDIPPTLSAKVTSCKSLTSNPAAFCEFIEIDLSESGNDYINCVYEGNLAFKAEIDLLNVNYNICSGALESFCSYLKESEINGRANGEDCLYVKNVSRSPPA